MSRQHSGMRTPALAIVLCSALAACASRVDPYEATEVGFVETRSAVSDAIGLPRDRPGPIMVDPGDETVPTPYGGNGARRVCGAIAKDIARLTVVLGPDAMIEPEPADTETDEDRSSAERSAMWRERGGGALSSGARDLYRSTIVGLNPARPVVRFIGRAGEIERAAEARREMADSRRAYLRGLYDGFECDEMYLTRAFDEYGLNTATAR